MESLTRTSAHLENNMGTVNDYESLSYCCRSEQAPLLEAFSGASIVQWYGNIERQLKHLSDEYESARNHNYVDKIREFLKTWRDNPIEGSLNREDLDVLSSAARQLAVDGWKLSDYFASVRNQLQKLIASQEELPHGAEESPEAETAASTAGLGKSKEPPPGEFGAQEKEGTTPGEEEVAAAGDAAPAAGGEEAETEKIDQAFNKLAGMQPT